MAFKLSKKVNNAIYGYGAAVVIIGALMKITYFSPSWAPGIANTMLTIGLVIEALISDMVISQVVAEPNDVFNIWFSQEANN